MAVNLLSEKDHFLVAQSTCNIQFYFKFASNLPLLQSRMQSSVRAIAPAVDLSQEVTQSLNAQLADPHTAHQNPNHTHQGHHQHQQHGQQSEHLQQPTQLEQQQKQQQHTFQQLRGTSRFSHRNMTSLQDSGATGSTPLGASYAQTPWEVTPHGSVPGTPGGTLNLYPLHQQASVRNRSPFLTYDTDFLSPARVSDGGNSASAVAGKNIQWGFDQLASASDSVDIGNNVGQRGTSAEQLPANLQAFGSLSGQKLVRRSTSVAGPELYSSSQSLTKMGIEGVQQLPGNAPVVKDRGRLARGISPSYPRVHSSSFLLPPHHAHANLADHVGSVRSPAPKIPSQGQQQGQQQQQSQITQPGMMSLRSVLSLNGSSGDISSMQGHQWDGSGPCVSRVCSPPRHMHVTQRPCPGNARYESQSQAPRPGSRYVSGKGLVKPQIQPTQLSFHTSIAEHATSGVHQTTEGKSENLGDIDFDCSRGFERQSSGSSLHSKDSQLMSQPSRLLNAPAAGRAVNRALMGQDNSPAKGLDSGRAASALSASLTYRTGPVGSRRQGLTSTALHMFDPGMLAMAEPLEGYLNAGSDISICSSTNESPSVDDMAGSVSGSTLADKCAAAAQNPTKNMALTKHSISPVGLETAAGQARRIDTSGVSVSVAERVQASAVRDVLQAGVPSNADMLQLLDNMLPAPLVPSTATAPAVHLVAEARAGGGNESEVRRLRSIADTRNATSVSNAQTGSPRAGSTMFQLRRRANGRPQLGSEEAEESPASPPSTPMSSSSCLSQLTQAGK